MKNLLPLMLVGTLGLTPALGCNAVELTRFGIKVPVPKALIMKSDPVKKRTLSTDMTQCVQFYFKKTLAYAGEFCASFDPNFLSDRGIMSYESIPLHARSVERPDSDMIAISPFLQYPLERFTNENFETYGASVDCDETNGAIYRATASCYVVIARFDGSKSFYSNFIIKTHIRSRSRVPIREIERFWKALPAM